MSSRSCGLLFALGIGLILSAPGCQKAKRYSPVSETSADSKGDKDKVDHPEYGWRDGVPPPDMPLVFVTTESQPEVWKGLAKFFNEPPPGAGMATSHLGQQPLNAAIALVSSAQLDVIQVKVPAGFPDPTPYIPASNPPTLQKWQLGRDLFFDPGWLTELEFV